MQKNDQPGKYEYILLQKAGQQKYIKDSFQRKTTDNIF
jgi:hypothetical protein